MRARTMVVHQEPWWLYRYLSTENLRASERHVYVSEDHSVLKRLFMDAYWNWCLRFVPEWMAPNLITLVGLFYLVASYAMTMCYVYFNPRSEPPWWVFFFALLCSFIYQTMDNLDGKQARRTNTSSVLGEMFDHGCDSLFLALSMPTWQLSLGMGPWMTFGHFFTSATAFYIAHVEEYYTQVLIMGPIQNPTEAQFFIFLVYGLVCVFGSGIWTSSLFTLHDRFGILPWCDRWLKQCHLTLRAVDLVTAMVIVCVVIAVTSNIKLSFAAIRNQLASVRPSRKKTIASADNSRSTTTTTTTIAGHAHQHPFLVLMPHLIVNASIFLWALWSPTDILTRYPFHIYAIYGLTTSYLCIKLILARICKMSLQSFPPLLLVPLLGAINVSPLGPTVPILPEITILYIVLGVISVSYSHFVASILFQFTAHYRTGFLRVRPRTPAAAN